MKKHLSMTTAMAASLAALPGCSSNDWGDEYYVSNDTAICTDREGKRVDDDRCDDDRYRSGSGYYGWYYIRSGSRLPYYGDSVRDPRFSGSFSRDANRSYSRAPTESRVTRSQAVSRGGFGSSSRSFGGGRS